MSTHPKPSCSSILHPEVSSFSSTSQLSPDSSPVMGTQRGIRQELSLAEKVVCVQ